MALHLTSVDKGQVTQPWQGEGVLLDDGHGHLVPFVLTGGRRQRYRTQAVGGLDLVPLAGFERIAVATPSDGEARASDGRPRQTEGQPCPRPDPA